MGRKKNTSHIVQGKCAITSLRLHYLFIYLSQIIYFTNSPFIQGILKNT